MKRILTLCLMAVFAVCACECAHAQRKDPAKQDWAKFNPDFFSKSNFLGRGISGQTSSHMLVRFRCNVIELNPRTVLS